MAFDVLRPVHALFKPSFPQSQDPAPSRGFLHTHHYSPHLLHLHLLTRVQLFKPPQIHPPSNNGITYGSNVFQYGFSK